jgi:hypothetical protein
MLAQVRFAVAANEDDFAVKNDAFDRQRFDQIADRAELIGPTVALAREDGDAAIALVRLSAIPVELDLMDPIIAQRWSVDGCRIERLYVAVALSSSVQHRPSL